MASNVPLRRVREGVVSAIVERIPVVENDMVSQRREIANVVKRWGELIDKIGGVDAVETVSVLQVGSLSLQLFQSMGRHYFRHIVRRQPV
jgi:translation initiation factor eIF-2B subunit epsilon